MDTTEVAVTGDELAAVRKLQEAYAQIRGELAKVIIGQDEVIEELLIALFCRGHALLVGVPGLAKTLLISTLSRTLGLSFSRIQFTPDLMPSDITGTEVIEEDRTTGGRQLRFVRGPVFANVILADEINRTPPKTQSALLEAMQEHHVTVAGRTYPLEEPFLVVATQNPEDLEGTYRLPEAQVDRFGFRLRLSNLGDADWIEVVRRRTGTTSTEIRPVLSRSDVVAMQTAVRQVGVPRAVCAYAAGLVSATHVNGSSTPEAVRKYVRLGCSPRGIQALILGAKVRALCDGRSEIRSEDIRSVAVPALGHRMLLNFEGQADRIETDQIIRGILEKAAAA